MKTRYAWLMSWLLCSSLAIADEFPAPYDSERNIGSGPLPPDEAAAQMQLPPGFVANVFAAEPDVQNPIAMTWDPRGRLWIAENYTYADAALHFDLGLRDRVLIFEDTDGDGRFNNRTVFTDDVQMLTSIEVGHGGVWLMCPPRLMFIPDADHDDVPDGPAEVKLDGFTVATDSYHNFANGLRWGPDGWLYGRCGHSCPGLIGTPGTPDNERHHLAGSVWRYHPIRKTVEVLASGTTNPWGHDWNADGEGFFINTVHGHLWHIIPGAHYVCGSTIDPNQRVYELIDQHADHFHFDTGKSWADSRGGAANEFGGGHAHSGATIYLGDNWPEEYRGRLFTLNLHGLRLNQEILEREGSGYVAHHEEDFFISADPWFRGIDLSYGPDGAVYVIDWSDIGECHERDGVHRTSGRIFRIAYGADGVQRKRTPAPFNLQDDSVAELVARHRHPNEWFTCQARIVLAERAERGIDVEATASELLPLLDRREPEHVRIRALYSLAAINAVDTERLLGLFGDPNEHVRAATVRLLSDAWPLDDPLGPVEGTDDRVADVDVALPALIDLAESDLSGLVRLSLASTIQRLPVSRRSRLAAALVSRAEDADDHNLPLLVWYGLIPVADQNPMALVEVVCACRWPTTRRLITRRLTEEIEDAPEVIDAVLAWAATADGNDARKDVLAGMEQGLTGWRRAPRPKSWESFVAVLDDETLAARARNLSVVFGDGRALDEVRRIALDGRASNTERSAALETLIDAQPDDLRSICTRLLTQRFLNTTAAKGLARFDDPEVAEQIAESYRRFFAPDRPQMISLLASRASFAGALLDAIDQGRIPREDLSPFQARQIRGFGDEALSQRLTDVWGTLRDSPEEKQRRMAELREQLTSEALADADRSQGRVLFQSQCGKCHRMYGEGSTIAPDLTGSNRGNLNYLLENIIDPSAVVDRDHRMTVLVLEDGRLLNGLVAEETDRTITLQSQTEKVTVDKSEVAERRRTPLSPMPDGLLDMLQPEQVLDLFAYLQHPSQVPLPTSE